MKLILFFLVLFSLFRFTNNESGENTSLLIPTPEQCRKVKTCVVCVASLCSFSINEKGESFCVSSISELDSISFIVFPEDGAVVSCPLDMPATQGGANTTTIVLLTFAILLLVGIFGLLIFAVLKFKRAGTLNIQNIFQQSRIANSADQDFPWNELREREEFQIREIE